MNGYDTALLVAVLVAGLVGAIKGFVRIVLGVGALVAAFLLASWFDGVAGSLLSRWITSESLRHLVGFAVVFLVVLIVGALAAWAIVRLLTVVHLRWLDRLAGAAAGMAGAILLFAALTVPLAADLPQSVGLLQNSRSAPYILAIGRQLDAAVPASVRQRFRDRVARLEERWKDAMRPAPPSHK